MVLEESLVFDSKESASEFISFLREGGCKGKIVPKKVTFEEELLTGSFDNFIAMLDVLIEDYLAELNECVSEGDELDHTLTELQVKELLNNKKSILSMKADLTEFLEMHKPGDLIYSRKDHAYQFIENLQSFIEDPDNEDGIDRVTKDLDHVTFQIVLSANNFTEERDEDVYLTKEVSNVGELIIERTMFNTIESDTLDATDYDLSLTLNCYVDLLYEVIIDPKVYITFQKNDLLSFLQIHGLDEDTLEDFENNLFETELIIGQFLTQLEQTGPISLEEFTALMKNPPVDEDLPEEPVYNFAPEYTAALVSDLLKLRIIKGNNRNIHI